MNWNVVLLVVAGLGVGWLLYVRWRGPLMTEEMEAMLERIAPTLETARRAQSQITDLIAEGRLGEAHMVFRDLKKMRDFHKIKEWCLWPMSAEELLAASLAAGDIERAEYLLADVEDLSRRVKIDHMDYEHCKTVIERMREHYTEVGNIERADDLSELLSRFPGKFRDQREV